MTEDREDATSGGKHPRSGLHMMLQAFYISQPQSLASVPFLIIYPSPSSSGRVLPICTKLALYPGIPRAGGGRLGRGLVRSLLDRMLDDAR